VCANQLQLRLRRLAVARQRSGGELGKLLVVALREIGPDLPDVFLNDIEVVEQPIPAGLISSPRSAPLFSS